MAGFIISGGETLGSATRELVSNSAQPAFYVAQH
jgi:hypothetical protein